MLDADPFAGGAYPVHLAAAVELRRTSDLFLLGHRCGSCNPLLNVHKPCRTVFGLQVGSCQGSGEHLMCHSSFGEDIWDVRPAKLFYACTFLVVIQAHGGAPWGGGCLVRCRLLLHGLWAGVHIGSCRQDENHAALKLAALSDLMHKVIKDA